MKRKVLKHLIPMALILSVSSPVFANTNNTNASSDMSAMENSVQVNTSNESYMFTPRNINNSENVDTLQDSNASQNMSGQENTTNNQDTTNTQNTTNSQDITNSQNTANQANTNNNLQRSISLRTLAVSDTATDTTNATGTTNMTTTATTTNNNLSTTQDTTQNTTSSNSNNNKTNEDATIDTHENQYITVKGKITEVTNVEDSYSFKVVSESDTIIFKIGADTQLLNASGAKMKVNEFEEGRLVSISYGINTPMALSLPAQITPEVVIAEGSEYTSRTKVDYFDYQGISSDRALKLNVSDATKIVDIRGNVLTKESITDKNLVVFYTVETRSIPAQTTPSKIIVLNDKEIANIEETQLVKKRDILDKLTIQDRYEIGDLQYVKLTAITEALGFSTEWNAKTGAVTIKEGTSTYSIVIGDKDYGYNQTIATFIAPPIIINNRTYVEAAFIDKLVQLYK